MKKLLTLTLICSLAFNAFAARKRTNKLQPKATTETTKPKTHIPKDIVTAIAPFLLNSPEDLLALMQVNKDFFLGVQQLIKSENFFKEHPELRGIQCALKAYFQEFLKLLKDLT